MSENNERPVEWDTDHLSRRKFIVGAAAVAVAGTATAVVVSRAGSASERVESLAPVCMAMHVHASASEGSGSMQAQLAQAERAGVDVLWWTEHDHRMSAHDAPARILFRGPTEALATGARWAWTAATQGPSSRASHTFLRRQAHPEISPYDFALNMKVAAQGKRVTVHRLSGQAENELNRTSLAGLTVRVDVMPIALSQTSYIAMEVVTSYRPKSGSGPSGIYTLSYHIGGSGVAGISRLTSPTNAVITLAAPTNQWTTLSITPHLDITRLWAGIDGRDASLFEFSFAAGSYNGKHAEANFSRLEFHRTENAGRTPLDVQKQLMTEYALQYPTVHQIQALEVSLTTPHLGWYGGSLELMTYKGVGPLPSLDPEFARSAVDTIHRSGGLASYCHPFGTSVTAISAAAQEAARRAKSAELIDNSALGCDLIEVGYRRRGGCNLAQHESVWDNCSRNGILLTGLGTSDDHSGRDWIDNQLNFVTWVWAADTSESALLAALRRGRAYFGDIARFRGTLDLRLSDRSAMGAVSVSDAPQRSLTIAVTGLPVDATLAVFRGTVDFAGPASTEPTITRTTVPTADLDTRGETTIKIDTTADRFVRLVVSDQAGLPIALSNPVWLLRKPLKSGTHGYQARILPS